MNIEILSGLKLDECGTLVNNKNQPVHFRQGDMDGACGPYCVVMAMMALAKIDREKIVGIDRIDYRTAVGKLLREIHFLDPLVLMGATADNLCSLLYANRHVGYESHEGPGRKILQKAKQSILNNRAVILDVKSSKNENLNHWVLGIGASDTHLFLLDPAHDLPASSIWNSTLTITPTSTNFGYRYTSQYQPYHVAVSTMIEIF